MVIGRGRLAGTRQSLSGRQALSRSLLRRQLACLCAASPVVVVVVPPSLLPPRRRPASSPSSSFISSLPLPLSSSWGYNLQFTHTPCIETPALRAYASPHHATPPRRTSTTIFIMPVELRKRKAPQPPPAPAPAPKKKAPAAPKATRPDAQPKKTAKKATGPTTSMPSPPKTKEDAEVEKKDKDGKKVAVGDVVDLEGFGGEIETNDGQKTSLKKLVDESKSGVVLFTYPKASTPGCTNQVCLFRDAYEPLTGDGLAIYGLSADSLKANTTFKEKQRLQYPLLCDPQATLIAAIGLRKQPKGTQRGVFVVDKAGKVLVAEAGGPAATVERVKELVEKLKKKD
ncbi:thioredoxin peroxidase dot5 [Purpureocillium takamizusanense]|uniref:thioredoxin-dependent peroxiredoxin n=1 Tax=Purpureocillium takamizusanense TaxID=2060973 RepID=A0A9Q8QJL9_9HYPO|nr:thioredoxin peroxidase dot5 [Purpureocillium takamizusanense]UNI20905.1 thioredoxin peroxidase dot5 [Purpureocillium takamizusanense]